MLKGKNLHKLLDYNTEYNLEEEEEVLEELKNKGYVFDPNKPSEDCLICYEEVNLENMI